MTSAIPVSPSVVSPGQSSVPLQRLDRVDRPADDEESDIKEMNSIRYQAHTKKHFCLELDTDKGEE